MWFYPPGTAPLVDVDPGPLSMYAWTPGAAIGFEAGYYCDRCDVRGRVFRGDILACWCCGLWDRLTRKYSGSTH